MPACSSRRRLVQPNGEPKTERALKQAIAEKQSQGRGMKQKRVV